MKKKKKIGKGGKNAKTYGDGDEDEDEDDAEEEASSKAYVPNKMAAVHFDANEKEAEKRRKELEKMRRKASKSGIVQHLREELFPDKPEVIKNMSGYVKDDDDIEREQYEEDNFLRLTETKADKKKRKKRQREDERTAHDFDNFDDDFGDLTAAMERGEDEELGGTLGKKKRSKVQELLEKARMERDMGMDGMDDFMDDSNAVENFDEFDADHYKSLAKQQKNRKKDRAEKYPKPTSYMNEVNPMAIEEGKKRAAGGKIIHNRGLTRSRPKDTKNARTKNRKKFDKAVSKRKSQVQEYKGKTASYGGEGTGIKTNVVKSVKI